MSDSYPGDFAYTQLIQKMYKSVLTDSVSMAYWEGGRAVGRSDLCRYLADKHNGKRHEKSGQTMTNAKFMGLELTADDCLAALRSPRGFSSPAGLTAWSGRHSGTWYGETTPFADDARWDLPIKETTRDPKADLDRSGKPRDYELQKVEFLKRAGSGRHGWNKSHPDVPYVWGWDPKEGSDERGQNGAHLAFPFEKDGAHGLIWFTPKELFLECIRPKDRRCSAGLYGCGQWAVS